MLSAGCPRPLGACIVWCVFSCICVHVWPSVDFSQRLRNLAVPSLKRLTVNEPSQPNSISRFEDLKEVSPETTGLTCGGGEKQTIWFGVGTERLSDGGKIAVRRGDKEDKEPDAS